MNSSGSGTAASSSSLAVARCSSSELKNSRKFRTAMHSSLYQSNRLCGVPSIGRKTSAMSTLAGTAHSSKEHDEKTYSSAATRALGVRVERESEF